MPSPSLRRRRSPCRPRQKRSGRLSVGREPGTTEPDIGLAAFPPRSDTESQSRVKKKSDPRSSPRERNMPIHRLRLSAIAAAFLLTFAGHGQAQTALSGTVTSAQEPTMGGVLVTAKREGSTISTTVVTNDKGQY